MTCSAVPPISSLSWRESWAWRRGFTRMQRGLEQCQQALEEKRYDDARAMIASLRALDQEDSNGL